MANEIIQLVTGLFTILLGLAAWIYNRELKKTDKNVADITLMINDIYKENKNIKTNYITRFENLHDAQHESEIAILEGLSKISYDLLTKIDQNNKELKVEIFKSIDDKVGSAISLCKLGEARRNINV